MPLVQYPADMELSKQSVVGFSAILVGCCADQFRKFQEVKQKAIRVSCSSSHAELQALTSSCLEMWSLGQVDPDCSHRAADSARDL